MDTGILLVIIASIMAVLAIPVARVSGEIALALIATALAIFVITLGLILTGTI